MSRWQGPRGETYVLIQTGLIALVFFGPTTFSGLPPWPEWLLPALRVTGIAVIASGVALILFAVLHLGSSLSPLPLPRESAKLVVTGPYRLVRHPIYSSLILVSLGWSLVAQGWLTLFYTLLLAIFFDRKARREEHWLRQRFPEYAGYQQRVRRLIPFLY